MPFQSVHPQCAFRSTAGLVELVVQILIGDFQRENPSGSPFLKNCGIMGDNVL